MRKIRHDLDFLQLASRPFAFVLDGLRVERDGLDRIYVAILEALDLAHYAKGSLAYSLDDLEV